MEEKQNYNLQSGDFSRLIFRSNGYRKNSFTNKEVDYEIVEDCLRLSCQIHVIDDITVQPIMTVENSGLDAGPRPAD